MSGVGSSLQPTHWTHTVGPHLQPSGSAGPHLSCDQLHRHRQFVPRLATCRSLVSRARTAKQGSSADKPQRVAAKPDLPVSQEVAAVLPALFELEGCFDGNFNPDRALDTAKLLELDNKLSKLWSGSEALALATLANLPLEARKPRSPASPANQTAIQTGIFCEQLVKLHNPLRQGGSHLDHYVMSSLCLEVQ